MSRPQGDINWNIEGKEDIRRAQTKNYKTDKVAKQAGFLPASDCLCLIEAVKNGTIDQTTELFLFDDNQEILDTATAKAKSLGFLKITSCYGDALDNINHLMNMRVFLPDFVFLDLCGEYNKKIAITIRRLLRRCPVSLTVRPYNRKDTKSRDNFIIPSGVEYMNVAGKVLNDPARKNKYNYEGIVPAELTQLRSQQILASIMSTSGGRCYFATNYQGKQRPMLAVALG